MALYVLLPTLLLAVVVQTALFSQISVLGVKPDLMLVATAGWAITRGVKEGALWVILGGLLVDLFSSAPLGRSTIALTPVLILAVIARMVEVESSFLLSLGVIFIGTLLYESISRLVLQAWHIQLAWGYSLLWIALSSALVNTLLAPPVYWALHYLCKQSSPAKGITFTREQ